MYAYSDDDEDSDNSSIMSYVSDDDNYVGGAVASTDNNDELIKLNLYAYMEGGHPGNSDKKNNKTPITEKNLSYILKNIYNHKEYSKFIIELLRSAAENKDKTLFNSVYEYLENNVQLDFLEKILKKMDLVYLLTEMDELNNIGRNYKTKCHSIFDKVINNSLYDSNEEYDKIMKEIPDKIKIQGKDDLSRFTYETNDGKEEMSKKFKIQEVKADGNCFYYAVLEASKDKDIWPGSEMLKDENLHDAMERFRKELAEFMESDKYKKCPMNSWASKDGPEEESNELYKKILRKIEKPGLWGGEEVIGVINCLAPSDSKLTIFQYNSISQTWSNKDAVEKEHDNTIYLITDNIHYNWLKPIEFSASE